MSFREVPNKQICTGSNGFGEALPNDYETSGKTYPLLIFIHGLGEGGNGSTELSLVFKHGPLAQVKWNNYDTPFVMIAPQFKRDLWAYSNNVQQAIDYAKANYRVDKVFVTGLSMGGGATWDYAQYNPTKLLAILPVCGALSPNANGAKAIGLAKLPVYATHNLGDGVVPYSHSTGWVNGILAAGGNAKLLSYASTTHDSWTRTYDLTKNEFDGYNWAEWLMQFYQQAIVQPPVDPKPTTITILPTDEKYITVSKGWAQTSKDIYGADKNISGTDDQVLYNAERWGAFSYEVPLPNGDYTVKLKFAELFHSSIGRRVFNVDIEGQRVLAGFDILANVPKFTALEKSFQVKVTDGKLSIGFTATVDNAKITAIDIIPGIIQQYNTKVEISSVATGKVLKTYTDTFSEPVKVDVK